MQSKCVTSHEHVGPYLVFNYLHFSSSAAQTFLSSSSPPFNFPFVSLLQEIFLVMVYYSKMESGWFNVCSRDVTFSNISLLFNSFWIGGECEIYAPEITYLVYVKIVLVNSIFFSQELFIVEGWNFSDYLWKLWMWFNTWILYSLF